jgi:hypothetical protein
MSNPLLSHPLWTPFSRFLGSFAYTDFSQKIPENAVLGNKVPRKIKSAISYSSAFKEKELCEVIPIIMIHN